MARWTSIFLFIGCISCSPKGPAVQDDSALSSSPQPSNAPKRAGVIPPPSISASESVPLSPPDTFPPLPSRNMNDMVAGCPNQNPAKRPRGSNCFGIFPEQCGADQAKAYVGQVATPAVRNRIRSFAPGDGVRFIMPGEAVIENLLYGRLNVGMDKLSKIVTVDCY
jgi:hypothetical protein